MIVQEPLAIVSMACRFPGGADVETYGKMLLEGRDAFRPLPFDRFTDKGFRQSKRAVALLDDIRSFDPSFFGLTAAEAIQMDPQQRLCLELAHETMMACGGTERYAHSPTGVLIGVAYGTYGDLLARERLLGGTGDRFTATGGLNNMIAARIAHVFDIQGPAMAIDTACSSALAALHYAAHLLWQHTCRQVLVGGVHLNATATALLAMEAAGALSPQTEHYRIFDERSDGFFMGEGAGMLMLKRLSDALEDGDTILVLMPSIAMNNDGRSVSVMAPRPAAQRAVVQEAYTRAGLDRARVAYIETHGTGTPLGDAVEIRSLSQVFNDGLPRYIGTAKANIGHLLGAAGMAGLIKTVWCLMQRRIPPHLHCEHVRDNLQLGRHGFILPGAPIELTQDAPLLMGVNSFGFGGTNVHVVLEEYPEHREKQQLFRQIIPEYQKQDYWAGRPLVDLPPVHALRLEPFVLPENAAPPAQGTYITVDFSADTLSAPEVLPPDVFLLFPPCWQLLHQWFLQHSALLQPETRLWVITCCAVQPAPGAWAPELVGLTAYCKTAQDELPCTLIQLDLEEKTVTNGLLAAFCGQTFSKTPYLLQRKGEWMQPVQAPFPLEQTEYFGLTPGSVCLITGGMGDTGMALAKTLLAQGLTVILNGRRKAPDPVRWAALPHDSGALHYHAADCSHPDEARQLMEQIQQEFGQLDVVWHAAGLVQPSAWDKLDAAQVNALAAPKLGGLQALHTAATACGWTHLRWVLFSSISATLPGAGAGLTAYAIANASMDQYGAWMRQQGATVTSVAWGPLEGEGMSKNAVFREKLAQSGIFLLSQSAVQSVLAALSVRGIGGTFLCWKSGVPVPVQAPQRQQETTTAVSADGVLPMLQALLSDVLEVPLEAIQPDTNLMELGLDSLNAMDMASRLESKGFRNIPFELFFEHQTLQNIAAHLSAPEEKTAPEDVAEVTDLPLSRLQEAFLKGHYLSKSPSFTLLRQTLSGTLDKPVLEQAAAMALKRHPMLRARVARMRSAQELKFRQHIVPAELAAAAWKVEWVEADISTEVLEDQIVNRRFHIEYELPLRLCVHAQGGQCTVYLLMHHAFSDGWSLLLLAQEIWTAYEHILNGETPVIEPEKLSELWTRVAERQADEAIMETWTEALRRFPKQLTDGPLHRLFRLDLPWVNEPGAFSPLLIPPDVAAAMAETARRTQISLQALYFSAFRQGLSEWSGVPDVVVNCAVSGRHAEWGGAVNRSVGCFADAFPFYAAEQDPLELARQFENWYSWTSRAPGLDSPTLIRQMQALQAQQPLAGFSFVKFPIQWAAGLQHLHIRSAGVRGFTFQTRFTLHCWDDPEGLKCGLNYPQHFFEPADVQRFQLCFLKALERITGVEQPAKAPKVVVEKSPSAILDMIRRQAQRHPRKIAVQGAGNTLTYKELLEESAHLAGTLLQQGVTPGSMLAWIGGHSEATLTTLLAALRLGCTWVPIDRQLPVERIEWMLRETQPAVCLTEPGVKLPISGAIPFDSLSATAAFADINVTVPGDQVAYIIFTSGSSGKPKGVPIEKQSLERYINWCLDTFGFTLRDRFLLSASIGFDASLRQLLAPLCCGGQLHLLSTDTLRSPNLLIDALCARKISVWSAVPTLTAVLAAALEHSGPDRRPPIRIVQVGGEALVPELVQRWQGLYGAKLAIYNLYGPTETTINTTYFKIKGKWQADKPVPIGRAAAGAALLVMDEAGREAEMGELWIGGASLTPGYLNGDTSRFVAYQGRRYYRSGDRVRRDAGGDLYYLGRMDRQIKWHGYRIEPGEIEARIRQNPGVKDVLVALVNDSLCAAWVGDAAAEQLEQTLRSDLPEYMIPRHWQRLDAFPVLENGKKDLQQLQLLLRREPVAIPGTAVEMDEKARRMASLWSEILQKPVTSGDTHFFREGGDSIMAMLLFVALEEQQWRPVLSVDVLYRHPVLSDFVRHFDMPPARIEVLPNHAATSIDWLPLSSAQTGFLYAAQQHRSGEHLWRAMIPIRGPLDPEHFGKAVAAVFERHPALRGKLEKVQGKYRFTVLPLDEIPRHKWWAMMDWSALTPAEQAGMLSSFLEKTATMHTGDFPLLRCVLIRRSPEEYLWHITTHHLLADGLSQQVFFNDLWEAYGRIASGETPFDSDLPYPDEAFAADKQTAAEALDYWKHIWRKPWAMPQGEKHLGQHGFSFVQRQFELQQIETAAQKADVTPFVMVLYSYYRTLAEWFAQEDMVIGIAQHGRDARDSWKWFGNFAYAAPVRLETAISAAAAIDNLAQQVRSSARFRPDVAALRKTLGHNLKPAQWLGSRFFMSWLPQAKAPVLPEGLRVDMQQTQTLFQPSESETAIMLTVRPDADGRYGLNWAFNAAWFSEKDGAAFTEKFLETLNRVCPPPLVRIHHQPFPSADTLPLDAALVAYLPSLKHVSLPKSAAPALKQALFAGKSCLWSEYQETTYGRTGVFLLPWWPEEITPDKGAELARAIHSAARQAAAAGARSISLAGMLPAATVYGNLLKPLFEDSSLRVSTGHSSTVVAVVKTLLRAVEHRGLAAADTRMACIGLGSIGTAVLRCFLRLAPQPAALTLCDVAGKTEQLLALADTLRREHGFEGEIRIHTGKAGLQGVLRECNLIVGAAFGGEIVDVAQLQSGTILVDDSFPPCFNEAAALERMRNKGDVLITGGGLLHVPGAQKSLYLPEALAEYSGMLLSAVLPETMASCQFESLLLARHPQLPPTFGLADYRQALTYFEWMKEVNAAPFHVGAHFCEGGA